ncbi:outer membrane beta-barrel protein [Novosphingobium sp. PS1R-30]|uniref:Outer membrane beta-barrel protein n=1 Tax=Novosphingobium anseongense TaxID=3133436 RepID=A0ABU8S2X9_9SPHN
MRRTLIGLALAATTAIATPALAREKALYIELDGGIMFVDDFKFDLNGVNDAARLNADRTDLGLKVDGYDFGGIVGYDLGAVRLEAEASYRRVRSGALTVAGLGTSDTAGNSNALSFMGNALVDFGPDDGLQGYVGGGAGWARVSKDIRTVAGPVVDDSDGGFAWQAIAGVRAPLTRTIDVGIKYRFFNAANVDLVAANGDNLRTRWRSHSLMGTLTFNLGGAPDPVQEYVAPTPPPPPPPPAPVYEPAPPPPPAQVTRPAERG